CRARATARTAVLPLCEAARFARAYWRSGHSIPGVRTAQQPGFQRLEYGARTIANAELGEDAGDLILDRPLRGAEGLADFPVAVPASHQTHDFRLAFRKLLPRCVRVDADCAARAQQPLGHGGLKHGRTAGDGADRREQLLIRDVLEQEAARARAYAIEHDIAVVKGRENECRRQGVARGQCAQHVDPVPPGHADVQQQYVHAGRQYARYGCGAVCGFTHYRDAAIHFQQCPDALADEHLVIGDQDPDHAAPPCPGSRAVTAKPRPGSVTTRSSPPACATRSRMPRIPKPPSAPSLPRPSSRASMHSVAPSHLTQSHRLSAFECRAALVTISWAQRSSVWARPGSAIRKPCGMSRWMRGRGTAATSVCRASATFMPSRAWDSATISRTSLKSRRARLCAVATLAWAAPWVSCRAASRFRDSAVRWWPRASCSSRAMRSRSAMRLLSARILPTPRNSALLTASAARAALSCAMALNTKNATSCRPRYGGSSSHAPRTLKVTASATPRSRVCPRIQAIPNIRPTRVPSCMAISASSAPS